MTTRILLFTIAIIGLSACAKHIETVETFDDNGKLQERITRKKQDFARHGDYVKYFPNGKMEEKAFYQNDTLQGQRVLFEDTGDTLIVENYKNGNFEGDYRSYYEANKLSSKGKYINGAMSGQWDFYYKNNQMKESVTFVNNNENGPFIEYHENGKLKAKGTYKTTEENIDGNKEHGELELYDENGELERKMDCVLGRCNTTWKKEGLE